MNERSEQITNQPGTINDLTVAAQQADAIKGGPRLIIKKAPTFAETGAGLPGLEPDGEVEGGTGAIERLCGGGGGGFINNHNETIVTDDVEVSAKP